MKAIFHTFIALSVFLLLSCSSTSGVDPHLSVEEQQEATQVNLVGKWKIRRPQPIGTGKKVGLLPSDCAIDEIEFFDDNDYILTLSIAEDDGEEEIKIYRGKYDLLFTETGDEVSLDKIVLMEVSYTPGGSFPSLGSIATIDEIELSETNVSFRIQLGESTNEFCNTGQAISLDGDKEEEVAPDAAEDSNHVRILNEWRLISVNTTATNPDIPADGEILCSLFEGEFFDRCFNEETGEFASDCSPAVTTTLLISGYGTYLFSYYDANQNLLSTQQGDWRWRTDAVTEFSVFEVKSPDETFEEANIQISITQLSDTVLQLTEDVEEEEGEIRLTYSFQLATLDYQDAACGDFTASALKN